MTRVIHIKNAPKGWKNNPDYVYIGRAGKGLSGYFGNPHPVGYCSECGEKHVRGSAIEAFDKYFRERLSKDETFKTAILGLKGKTLICFCRPSEGFKGKVLCHGQIIAAFIDNLSPESIE